MQTNKNANEQTNKKQMQTNKRNTINKQTKMQTKKQQQNK